MYYVSLVVVYGYYLDCVLVVGFIVGLWWLLRVGLFARILDAFGGCVFFCGGLVVDVGGWVCCSWL